MQKYLLAHQERCRQSRDDSSSAYCRDCWTPAFVQRSRQAEPACERGRNLFAGLELATAVTISCARSILAAVLGGPNIPSGADKSLPFGSLMPPLGRSRRASVFHRV